MSIAEKLQTVAENQQKVYDAGHSDGVQSEYDRFWDAYQAPTGTGNLLAQNYCMFAYAGFGWTDTTFKPKYNMRPVSDLCTGMFRESAITDLKSILDNCGVTLNFRQASAFNNVFTDSTITHVGSISTLGATSLGSLFNAAKHLQTIEELVLKTDGSQSFSSAFTNAIALTDITVTGCIGKAASFQYCPLSPTSMKSIIAALKNFTGTGSEHSVAIKFNEQCWTALEADSPAPDGGTWKDYVSNTLSWNV